MTTSRASDGQHQDFGAIEAAVKETARGRAFLANYARRVQQSDMLTMLARLGRLERLSDELALRIAELEVGKPPLASQLAPHDAGLVPQGTGVVKGQDETAHMMQRVEELASVLGNLHRHAVQLASQSAGADGRGSAASSVEIDVCVTPRPDPTLLSPRAVGVQERADEEVLGKIAQALEP